MLLFLGWWRSCIRYWTKIIINILHFLNFNFSFQKHFADVSRRLCKFERPLEFESKMRHVKQILEEVQQQEHFMDLRSDEPEDLQTCHQHCMVRLTGNTPDSGL